MRKSRRKDDLPRVVANLMVAVPMLVLRTGLAYLRLKKRIHRSSAVFMTGMVDGGMPSEMARRLAQEFESELSIRAIIKDSGAMDPHRHH